MERIQFYTDYRKYLRDYYEDAKKRLRYFSLRYFCRKAGLTSHSLFRSVVEGKRNLTEQTISAFAKGIGLNETDGKFFAALVRFNQARTPEQKQQYLEDLRGLRRKVEQKRIPIDQYAYYSKWYHIAVRELACVMAWANDFGVLAKAVQPPIKKVEARQSVELLLRLGFLQQNSDGTYSQADPAITSGPEVTSVAVRNVNAQMAELGTEAIKRFPATERDISSLAIGISKNSYRLIKQEIQEFKSRVVRIVDDDNESNQVYDLNVQLFPLSKECGHGKAS